MQENGPERLQVPSPALLYHQNKPQNPAQKDQCWLSTLLLSINGKLHWWASKSDQLYHYICIVMISNAIMYLDCLFWSHLNGTVIQVKVISTIKVGSDRKGKFLFFLICFLFQRTRLFFKNIVTAASNEDEVEVKWKCNWKKKWGTKYMKVSSGGKEETLGLRYRLFPD